MYKSKHSSQLDILIVFSSSNSVVNVVYRINKGKRSELILLHSSVGFDDQKTNIMNWV